MIQIGQPHSSGHIKQNTTRLLGAEWTTYVLHHAGYILLCAGLVCIYPFVDEMWWNSFQTPSLPWRANNSNMKLIIADDPLKLNV